MNILNLLKSRIDIIYAKYLGEEKIEELPIYYIGGSQVLPPPLTPDEEDELLRRTFKRKVGGKKNASGKKFKIGCLYCKKIRKYRSRDRRFNINRNNRANEIN